MIFMMRRNKSMGKVILIDEFNAVREKAEELARQRAANNDSNNNQ